MTNDATSLLIDKRESLDAALSVLLMLGEDSAWGVQAIKECDGDLIALTLMMFREKERELEEVCSELEVVRNQHREATARGKKAESAPPPPNPAPPARPTISMSALARETGITPDATKKLIATANLEPVPSEDGSFTLYDRATALAAASVYLADLPGQKIKEMNSKIREQGSKISGLQSQLASYETGKNSPGRLQKTNDELRLLLDKRHADHSETKQELAKAAHEIDRHKARIAELESATVGSAEAQTKIADLEGRLALAIKARQEAEDREKAALRQARAAPAEKRPEPAQSAAVVGEETVQRIRNLQADLREKEREIGQLNDALTEANAKLATKKIVTADQTKCPECGSTQTYKFRGGKRMGCKACNSEMAVA